jgi:hypothetical protein
MSKILNILIVLVISLLSGILFLTGSCKTTTKATVPYIPPSNIVQYIPPSYYACISVSIDDLFKSYFTRYGNLYLAEQAYNDQIFLFSGLRVMASMLIDDNTLNYGNAQFIAMQPGAVGKLKAGDLIDIVGINRGPMPEAEGQPLSSWFDENGAINPSKQNVQGWLYFTDCIFIPSGSVQLPAPGGAAFVAIY